MKQALRLCGTVLIAALVPVVTASGQSDDAAAARLVRAMAAQLQESAHLPGLSIAISRNGHVVFAEGFGYADLEARRPVTPATRFRTGSVGKVITATALGKLVEEGRLDLDAPVQRYVPSFPVKAWPITSRALAGHLSGIPHYTDEDRFESRFYSSVLDALRVFASTTLRAEPGSAYRYSTHGFTLLSAAIEGAAKTPFLEYMEREIYVPLGMRSTGPDLRARPSPEMATFYRWANGRLSRVDDPEDPSYKWAGGGLTSTPADLLRLAGAYSNGFLRTETVSMMWASQRLVTGRETGVGLGWRNGRDVDGRRVLEHAGSMQGTRAVLSIFPEEHVVVALMTNREWSSTIEETAHMLALPFLRAPAPPNAPSGSGDLMIETVAVSGAKRSHRGTLRLAEGRGALTIDAGTPEEQVFVLFHLGVGDVYALVRADGIYHTTVRIADGMLTGRVIGYGSPQLTSPVTNPPFITFSGPFR